MRGSVSSQELRRLALQQLQKKLQQFLRVRETRTVDATDARSGRERPSSREGVNSQVDTDMKVLRGQQDSCRGRAGAAIEIEPEMQNRALFDMAGLASTASKRARASLQRAWDRD